MHSSSLLDVTLPRQQRDFPHLLESCRYRHNLSAFYRGLPSQWRHLNVRRAANCIYFVTDGDGFVDGSQGRVPMIPGHAVLMPTGSVMDLGCTTVVEKFWVDFNLLAPTGDDVLAVLKYPIDLGPYPLEHIRQAVLGSQGKLSSSALFLLLKGLVFMVLAPLDALLAAHLRLDPEFLERYHSLFELINERLDASLRIGDLAAALDTSTESLSRSFRRDMGQPLKAYLSNRLNQRAGELLAYTDYRVKEIAHRLGFADEYYFNRFFRKLNGCTPLEYRVRSRPVTGQAHEPPLLPTSAAAKADLADADEDVGDDDDLADDDGGGVGAR